MRAFRATAALLIVLGAALIPSASAEDDVIRPVWYKVEMFKRGAPFEVECERGSYLVGFDGRAGAWINHMRLVCARWNAAHNRLERPIVLEDRQIGTSQGGEPTHARCPTDTGIAGDFRDNSARDDSAYVLHSIEFLCENAIDGTRPRWREFGSTSPRDIGKWPDKRPHAGCPGGYLATGLFGRSGEFIDTLFGLVCRRRPTASPVAGTAVNDTVKAKAYNPKWAVSGTRLSDNVIAAGGGADIDTASTPPPPPQAPAPPMAETLDDTDVYRKTANGTFVRTDNDPNHFLQKGFVAPVLAKEGGWWKLDLTSVAFVKGEGWVAADQLKMK